MKINIYNKYVKLQIWDIIGCYFMVIIDVVSVFNC